MRIRKIHGCTKWHDNNNQAYSNWVNMEYFYFLRGSGYLVFSYNMCKDSGGYAGRAAVVCGEGF